MKTSLFIFLFTASLSYGQISSNNSYLYSGLNYQNSNYNFGSLKNSTTNILPLFGLYKVDKRNNINDFQFNHIRFENDEAITYLNDSTPAIVTGGQKSKSFSTGLSYHKIIGLNKSKESKYYVGIGFGTVIYYSSLAVEPQVSNFFPTTRRSIGSIISLKPVINYEINENMFVGISSNLHIFELSFDISKSENPAIPISEQKISSFNTNFFPNWESPIVGYDLQFIVGVKF